MNSKRQYLTSNSKRICWRGRYISAAVAILVVAFSAAAARNNNNQLCFPSTTWFGGTPDITKPVASDPGWNGAFRYVFGNGTPTPDVVLQGIRDANYFYISIEAHNMQSWDAANVVVLTFDSGNGDANMQRVVIFPVQPSTAEQTKPGAVQEIDYSQNDSMWNNINCALPICSPMKSASWLYSNALAAYTCQKDASNNCLTSGFDWTLAMRLPITTAVPNSNVTLTNAITAPTTGKFGFYVNVLRVIDVSGDAQESFWPNDDPTNQAMAGCSLSALCNPNSSTPTQDHWGFATQDTTLPCKGVSLGSQTQDISTNHSVQGLPEISTVQPNSFFAKVYNTSVDGTGNPITASGVNATFRIANYGLPSQWGLVPTVAGTLTISSISRKSGTVTVNTTSKVPFGPGDVPDPSNIAGINVTIAGVGDASFDGTFPITWNAASPPAPTQLTYAQALADGSSSGGTVSYSSIPGTNAAGAINHANPTGPQDIGPNNFATFTTDPWLLTPAQSNYYQTHHIWGNGLGEQCIQVQIDATPAEFSISTISRNNAGLVTANTSAVNNLVSGQAVIISGVSDTNFDGTYAITVSSNTQFTYSQSNTTVVTSSGGAVTGLGPIILNNSAVQNMYFGNASKFQIGAEISAKGYPARLCQAGQPCPTDQLFDLQTFAKTQKFAESCGRGTTQTAKSVASVSEGGHEGAPQCSQLTYVVHGCRHTGAYMTVNGKKLLLCDGVGAFGYVIQHDGDTSGWTTELTGPGLQKTGAGTYQIHVPQNGVTAVTTTAEPEYPGEDKLAAFLDVGSAIPTGGPITAFNKGFSLNAGLEYMIKPYDPKAKFGFSAEGIFGYHHFPANVGSALDIYQFSGNGKVYFPFPHGPKLRLFVNAGGGGYKLSPGSTYGGINVGGGVLWEQNAHWGFQLSNNFHTVFTPSPSPINRTKFDTVQVGIRYVF